MVQKQQLWEENGREQHTSIVDTQKPRRPGCLQQGGRGGEMDKPQGRKESSSGTQNPLRHGSPRHRREGRTGGRRPLRRTGRGRRLGQTWPRAPTSILQPAGADRSGGGVAPTAVLRRGPSASTAFRWAAHPGAPRPLTWSAAEPAAADAGTGRGGTEGDRK